MPREGASGSAAKAPAKEIPPATQATEAVYQHKKYCNLTDLDMIHFLADGRMMMTMSTTKKTKPFRGHSKSSSDHHSRCHRRPSIGGRSNVIS